THKEYQDSGQDPDPFCGQFPQSQTYPQLPAQQHGKKEAQYFRPHQLKSPSHEEAAKSGNGIDQDEETGQCRDYNGFFPFHMVEYRGQEYSTPYSDKAGQEANAPSQEVGQIGRVSFYRVIGLYGKGLVNQCNARKDQCQSQ